MNTERLLLTAECRRLPNGRYMGVAVQSLIGRFSADAFERPCLEERDSEEEALRDAETLIRRGSDTP